MKDDVMSVEERAMAKRLLATYPDLNDAVCCVAEELSDALRRGDGAAAER